MAVLLTILVALGAGDPQMITVGPGEEIAVYDEGEGPAVMMVAGLSGCAYGYREVAPLLQAEGFRTIAVEPLALGRSGRPKDADYTLTAQADRLAAVLDALEVTDALVIAQGVSASMVLRMSYRRPDLVRGVVSIEGGAAESAATPTVRSGLKLAKVVAKLTGSRFLKDRFKDDLEKASGDDSWIDRRTLNWYFRGPSSDIQGTLNAFIAMTEQPEPEALTPNLPRIQQPVLVLLGSAEHTGALDEEGIAVLREGLPRVTFRTVEGAGHFIFEEQPQAVADATVGLAALGPAAADSGTVNR